MTKKLKKLSFVAALVFITIFSLVACDFVFGNIENSYKITLDTNEISVSVNTFDFGETFITTGSCGLFTIEGDKDGLYAVFSLNENLFFNDGKLSIAVAGGFSNEQSISYYSKFTNDTDDLGDILSSTVLDVYVDNKKVSDGWFIDFDANFFKNKITVKNEIGKATFELSEKYKDAIYKKMQLYLKKVELEKQKFKQR